MFALIETMEYTGGIQCFRVTGIANGKVIGLNFDVDFSL
jgi:hypothetical protein